MLKAKSEKEETKKKQAVGTEGQTADWMDKSKLHKVCKRKKQKIKSKTLKAKSVMARISCL